MKKILLYIGLTLIVSCGGESKSPEPEANESIPLSTNLDDTYYHFGDGDVLFFEIDSDCADTIENWPMVVKLYFTNSYYDSLGRLVITADSQAKVIKLSGEDWFTSSIDADGTVAFKFNASDCIAEYKIYNKPPCYDPEGCWYERPTIKGACEGNATHSSCEFAYDNEI